ncbi:MAG: molybdenum cofactor guanylyltransferase [Ilumatobacteraceae bacterium]
MLCGGASRRMGSPKPGVRWRGEPMASLVADALIAGGCAEVIAVGGDPAVVEPLGLLLVPDTMPGEGPLPAVADALRHAAGRAVMVVSCDVPQLAPLTVRRMLDGASGGCAVTVATTDRIEPLCAVWQQSALRDVERAVASGGRSIRDVLRRLDACLVTVPAADLRNVNTPGDLAD